MKIYQSFGIGDEGRLPEGSVECNFEIDHANILPNIYEGEDVLSLNLKSKEGYNSYGYGLIGKVKDEFMSDMKAGKVEELVGKEVVGFTHNDEPDLKGLSPLKKESSKN